MLAGDEQQYRPVYAHTLPDASCKDWEPLETHLAEVASRTGAFASVFGAHEWGNIVGCCHDLGKSSIDFQRYLFRTSDPDATPPSEQDTWPNPSASIGARCLRTASPVITPAYQMAPPMMNRPRVELYGRGWTARVISFPHSTQQKERKRSRPAWARGLNLSYMVASLTGLCRAPRGRMD